MKKISLVAILSFVFLALCSVFENIFRFITFENAWVPLCIGFGCLFLSGMLAVKAEGNIFGNSICFFINSIALGLCIRSWYMYREFDNKLWIMLLVSLACVIYLLLFYFSLYIPFLEKHINVYIWIYLSVSVLTYLLVMALSTTTYVSTFGYFMIIEIAFILAMCNHQYTANRLFRDIVVSTYSVLIVAIIIALIMLGADSIDGFDIGGGDIGGFKSPRKQKVEIINTNKLML